MWLLQFCLNVTEPYEHNEDDNDNDGDDDDEDDDDEDDDRDRNKSRKGEKIRKLPQAIIIGAKKAGTCKWIIQYKKMALLAIIGKQVCMGCECESLNDLL